MPEYLAPGVFVEEVPGGVKPIQGVSTSTIGMVGMTERGPVGRPTLVTSFGDFTRAFGGFLDQRVYTANTHVLPHSVQGAFDNGAGRIYVTRIVGTNAARAEADILGPVTGTTAAATTLAERAAAGAMMLRIASVANIVAQDRLLINDGPRSEYVTVASAPVALGVTLTGRLHADKANGVAVRQIAAPVVTTDLTAGLTGNMAAGGPLILDATRTALLNAGDILRITDTGNAGLTEYVTITTNATLDINEGSLLFDHPSATTHVEKVTLATAAATTTLSAIALADASLVALTATAGLAAGDVIRIGAAAATEYHQVSALVSDVALLAAGTTEIHAPGVGVSRQMALLRGHARDLGGWGNHLRLRASAAALCDTTVTVAAGQNDSPVHVTSSVGLYAGSVVVISRAGAEIARQRVTRVVNSTEIELAGGAAVALQVGDRVLSQEVKLAVELLGADGKVKLGESFDGLGLDPAHPRYAPRIIGAYDRATDRGEASGQSELIRLSDLTRDDSGVDLVDAAARRLTTPVPNVNRTLAGGDDDLATVSEASYVGVDMPDVQDRTGLHALTGIDDVSIVAVPGQSGQIVQQAMITHCERMRYRIAVLDSAPLARMADVQAQRQLYDSTRGALYYPWLDIADPFGRPTDRMGIPPSGHVCGAFALTDTERGVHKAPANVVVRGILGLQASVTTGQQEILNPLGINVIRDFASLGRAKRIWGARTVSSDTEWTYVPVRRMFLFVEKSIERGMQFAVFEPNGPALWATVQRSLGNFLTSIWRSGALAGTSADEAFFIEVGPSTMTQGDIDQGRLIVNIGIAPLKPAEFVIFRISQKTAGGGG